ncbi:hypothetical protein [Saccharibacillus endophyticus]|uniref:DUF2651 domain-containing protein n=1 Tax=Saccharibacillus endophyticus TaxID=2060666 RepID=A0ABQ1ZUK3_9BACL|nr:hypothetical protein [Saccharibacillus endophyticus]GGH76709.1 hypothetical protein GCM10007362_19360 [Saccharibacillus endophyticus]
MLFELFPDLNPLLMILVIAPILAVALVLIGKRLKLHAGWSVAASLFIPLLFIWTDWSTLKANVDSWVIYGAAYGAIAWVVGWVLKGRKVRA